MRTALAVAQGVNGTPSVYVHGLGVPAGAQAIEAATIAELRCVPERSPA
jgi:hypothetical protein